MSPTKPEKENQLPKKSKNLKIADSHQEPDYDEITRLAAFVGGVSMAFICLIDGDRHFIKSMVGLEAKEINCETFLCHQAKNGQDLFVLQNALKDERYAENPFVKDKLQIKFYARAPLISNDGQILGTLSIIDRRPRRLNSKQRGAILSLARQAAALLELQNRSEQLTRANDLFRQKEVKHRIIAETASDVIVTIDEQGVILFVNPAAEKTLGYKPEELIGNELSSIIPERLRAAHTAGMRRYLATNERRIDWTGVELPVVRKDGRELNIEVSFGESREGDKRAFTAVLRDITERKRIEAELRQSEERYRFLAESVPQQVWTANIAGELDFGNNRTLAYFGKKTKEELLGVEWLKVLHPEDVERTMDIWSLSLATGRSYENEFRLKRADGEYRWHLAQAVPLRNEKGEIVKWFGTNTDIHERKLADEILRKSEEYLNLFRHANDAILIFDPVDETVLDANDRACEIYGFTRGEFLGKSIKLLSQNPARGENQLKKLLKRGSFEEFETVQFRSDGTRIDFLINSSIIEFRGKPAVLSINRDITSRKKLELIQRETERRFQGAFDYAPIGMALVDAEGRWLQVNRSICEIVGYTKEELLATTFQAITHPDDLETDLEYVRQMLAGEIQNYQMEKRYIHKLGHIVWVVLSVSLVRDESDGSVYFISQIEDISRRKQAEAKAHALAAIVESSSDAIISKNLEGIVTSWNAGAEKIFGYPAAEAIGRHISFLFPPERLSEETVIIEKLKGGEAIEQFETTRLCKNGSPIPVSITISPIKNALGEIVGISKIAHDITERKRAEEQLLHNALHDELTGLPNRALFLEHLRHAVDRNQTRGAKPFAVLFLDFDQFKVINDSLGHMEGDKLLQHIARRLENSLRTGDIVARLGGDEFTVLLDDLDSAEEASQIAERINDDLKTPFKLAGRTVSITASIGIALSREKYKKPEEALRDADIAMYRAKAAGKACHRIFDPQMHEQARSRLQMEIELRRGVENREFCVYYQPVIDLHQEGKIVGFESLARWNHPTRGLVSPAEFIPLAEETGLIVPLGDWILLESCRQLRQWQQLNPRAHKLSISVNLSPKQFAQADLVERVGAALRETGISPCSLKLEITESHVMENGDAARAMMNNLRSLGVEISLDDFGTGYSSLSYLHRLPADYLKVDRSFVSRMADSDENYEIVHTIIKLAQNLKMKTVAEGIETEEQADQLRRLGCDFGQGFLFSKPLEAAAAFKLIDSKNIYVPFVNLHNPTSLDLIG